MSFYCSKPDLILVQLISILILCLIKEFKADIKCGIPGTSLKTLVKTPLNNEKVVENGIKVKYSCDYNDAPFLIGYTERECVDGEWVQPIPKCATLYTGNYLLNSTANSNAINISLVTSARISGLVVRVSSFDPIEVMNIKNIPSPECFKANTTIRDKIPSFGSSRRRYTTLFHCPTKDVDYWMHSEVNWILITFSEKIRNCEHNSCPAELEFIELYEAINDECLKPDVPAFGKLIQTKRNNALVRYKYQCEDFFVMQERRATEVVCTQYEEWSPKRLPKCVPNITCDVEFIDEMKVTYNWLWNDMEAVVGTVGTFECIDNNTKINGSAKRECKPNGEWSEELPQCLLITTTTIETTPNYPTPIRYRTTTANPYINQQNELTYPTHPNPYIQPTDRYPNPYPTQNPNPYPTQNPNPYPTQNPNPYPTQNQNPYPTPYPKPQPTAYPTPYPNPYQTPYPNPYQTPYPPHLYPTGVPPIPAVNEQNSNSSSLNATHFVYIILGILLGVLITIGIIFYIQKRRSDSYRNGSERRTNRTPVRDEVYYDHINNMNNNFNESRISNTCSADPNVDSSQIYPYDSAGYIQIEAVEALRMDSFRKYENYEKENTRRPLPEVPKRDEST